MDANIKLPARLGPMRVRDKWQYIAEDLSLLLLKDAKGEGPLVSVEDICTTYGMTREELSVLLQYQPFKNLVAEYGKRNAALGDNASLILRMQTMSSVLSEKVFSEVTNRPGVDISDVIKVWESMMKYAGYDPATNGSGKTKKSGDGENSGAAVAQVIIKIDSRIPGLEHCQQNSIKAEIVEDNNG